jgi:hypothetical protein
MFTMERLAGDAIAANKREKDKIAYMDLGQ